MSENLRIDLHTHSIFSDGELLPSELVRRADVLGHKAIAITDHVDASNIQIASQISEAVNDIRDNWDINVIPGVEITHVPIEVIDKLANKARKFGAEIIVVHGETIVEPVKPGTNRMSAECPEVDIIGHPGLITEEEVQTICEKKKADFDLMKKWYDGYSFKNVGSVYNPNSVMKAYACGSMRG